MKDLELRGSQNSLGKKMKSMSDNPLILVTGATGFLGRAIVQRLSKERCRVRTMGRRKPPSTDLPHYRAGNLSDRKAIAESLAGVDIVIHVAGLAHQHRATSRDAAEFFRTNSDGTQSVAQAAAKAGCKRMILVSSVAVYGGGTTPRTEAHPCSPQNDYARSKLEGERRAAEVATSSRLELVTLRMATIYGAGDPGNVARLMSAIERRCFVWVGSGQNCKSLIHVDDAARACIAAALSRELPQERVFNVSARPCTMEEIVSSIAQALGRRPPTIQIPLSVLTSLAIVAGVFPVLGEWTRRKRRLLDKWLSDEIYERALFCEKFGWQPHISLEDGLRGQVASSRRL